MFGIRVEKLTIYTICFIFSGGYAYEPLPSTSRNFVEEENDAMADELKDKIHALKSLSIDIGQEVKYQDKMLRGMVRFSFIIFIKLVEPS